MDNKVSQTYTQRFQKFRNELEQVQKQNKRISFYRLLIFIATITFSILFRSHGIYIVLAIIGISILPFLYLVKVSVKLGSKIKHLKELVKINQNELEAIKGNISAFHAGEGFVDHYHSFSYDIDIFGKESIYQAINRTCTGGGAFSLANGLKEPLQNKEEIEKRQNAVKELATELEWRQNFQATGNIVLENGDEQSGTGGWFKTNRQNYSNDSRFHDEILKWLSGAFLFLNNKLLKVLLVLLPALSIVFLALTIANIFPVIGFISYGLFQLFIVGLFVKKINKIHGQIGRKVHLLDKYEKLLLLIENKDFKSDLFQHNKKKLQHSGQLASREIKKLKSLVRALDNRMNLLFTLIANGYLLWDLQLVVRLEKWRKQNNDKLPQWLNIIYEFDFISSFAGFSYNNPNYTIPEIRTDNFYLELEQGGHPLINSEVCINNDIIINGHQQLLVITGANMAGKSTFLRTIGVNMVLAMAGSVVCAKKMVISPIQLHTSVRTSDSVQKSESYFFAELKRLKLIIDRMRNGEKLFVIIDEMLRGTNSKDKHHGSEALIEQLIRLNGSGLIATHDIALGNLAEKYPDNVKNYRFEVEIENNELEFDYKLKTGISQNLNATFLMKKMGITV